MKLPPGQRAVDDFPRFGTHLHRPPPDVPADPGIAISGLGMDPVTVPLNRLRSLPRREITADFHCVAGWSATDLRWEGVGLDDFYRHVIEPALPAGITVTHLVFGGLDGYRSVVAVEDALADDVLLAEHLDDRPLDSDHGAPLRLVSPRQYGYVNTKHLCVIEVHDSAPHEDYGALAPVVRFGLRSPLLSPHPRARVWREERNRWLPAWLIRPVYRRFIGPIRGLSRHGGPTGAE